MGTLSGRSFLSGNFHSHQALGFVLSGWLLLAAGSSGAVAATAGDGDVSHLNGFITRKETQARALAKELDLKVSPDVWKYFEAAKTGNVSATTNAFERLKRRSSQYEGSWDDATVGTPVWQTLIEVEVALEAYWDGVPQYSTAFGQGVVDSIPRGSIYFGGTDSGRGLITALCKSHEDADPFFTITQNALADGRYLDYLRAMYGSKIRIPTTNDSQQAFQDYLTDAQERLAKNQLKPGEDVRIVNDRVQVSGQVAVMAINGLIAKTIFDANTNHEFYLEQSFPLDWMFPHLTPYGLIFKVHRQPLAELTEEVVQQDRQFWKRQQKQLIGDWLTAETSPQELCEFAQKVFYRTNLAGFKGDPRFVRNDYATKLYSKLRSSVGELYQWRATNAKSAVERKRMSAEADLAYRQAFAFCPYSPEAMFGYVKLLTQDGRIKEAHRVALTAHLLDPGNVQLDSMVKQLEQQKRKE